VNGDLSPDHSAVWIEDSASHRQESGKLMMHGSTAISHAALLLVGPGMAKFSKSVETIPPPESPQTAGHP
jgi:hypothetical protein